MININSELALRYIHNRITAHQDLDDKEKTLYLSLLEQLEFVCIDYISYPEHWGFGDF
ncbi:MAG: hypothetical protein MJK10_01555 [Pseudomonadales bacterium]|nr:hypothetical protein [Pseudomonadales bacterium]NRA14555.1 hypothetical protein [Oceanospirillaceae bacterium]